MIDGACSLKKKAKYRVCLLGMATVVNLPSHHEQFTHHARSFADELLDQLRAADANERTFRMMSHGASQKRLSGAWRSIKQYTLKTKRLARLKPDGIYN